MALTLLPIEDALDAIRACNAHPVFLGAESLLHHHFPSAAEVLDPTTVHERVVLLDGVWATQMFRDRGAHERVICALQNNAETMLDIVGRLHPNALERDPASVIGAADKLLPVLLNAREPGKGKQHYSFACRFLHWTTRVHFPITDSRARTVVNRLQREHRAQDRITTDGWTYREDYRRWIGFYSGLIGAMSPAERDEFREADMESQRPREPRQNSLLRIWDKVFYQLGSPPGDSERTVQAVREREARSPIPE